MKPLISAVLTTLVCTLALSQAEKKETDDRFQALLLSVAGSYESYKRLEDNLHFAPTACAGPPPAAVRASRSKDESTHGGKLYYLYVLDPEAYSPAGRGRYDKPGRIPVYEKKAVAQAIVKQSWTAVPAENPKPGTIEDRTTIVQRDAKRWTTGERKDLFIMVQLDAKTEGSDNGWVYGTVSADGKTVTSSGRVASCMGCHEKAGDKRLLGTPR